MFDHLDGTVGVNKTTFRARSVRTTALGANGLERRGGRDIIVAD